MPTIKIDNKEIPFEDGDTIIRAAERAGVDIPHYCWHPGLSVAANCRMCLVEILPPPGRPAMQLDIVKWDDEKKDYIPTKKPKLQPSCQISCAPGMEVLSDSSNHVKEARAAVQELLLLNHPVDCPICDQAGECRLQDYWMEHSQKSKRMKQEVVHKPKAVVFGPTIVYDAERCILCTRCVRFSEEIAKDPVLSVRERGNLTEITVSPGRQLDHDYTLMTEHVCPVGALTSTDFRFKARVWFLKNAKTICQGCATGCNAFLDFDPRTNTPYRHRPRENAAVNQYWMCDEGMLSYKWTTSSRLLSPLVGGEEVSLSSAFESAYEQLKDHAKHPERVAVVISAQHSNEDNWAMVTLAEKFIGCSELFMTGKPLGKGDSILKSEDKNPNTRGAVRLCKIPPKPLADLIQSIHAGKYDFAILLGSDIEVPSNDLASALQKLKGVVSFATHLSPIVHASHVSIPVCTWAEAFGSFENRDGIVQHSEKALSPKGESLPAWKSIGHLGKKLGFAIDWDGQFEKNSKTFPKTNHEEAQILHEVNP